ncbi:MAG: MlaD family protein [Candidatus Acidiferrales bacterium]|jgi:phospholipid/cholesterol/gamma-HCH transport system substrate-binding protein
MSRAARLGAFIIATLAILAAGIFIIGDRQYLFTSTYRLKAQFSTVVGLDAGAEVRVGGVHSGSVRRIELPNKPSDKITVLMDLQRSTHEIIKQDSVAAIQTEGLLGNEYVSISFGSAQGLNVQDGDTIASQPPLVMADLIKKTDAILDSSREALANVTVATANLSSISAKVNQGQGTIGALINDKKMYTELDQTTVGMRDTVIHAQAGIADFQENMEALKQNFLLRGYFKKRGYEDSADLAKDAISRLPEASPLKTFTYEPKRLFDKIDTAKLKNQDSLDGAGQFLAANEFGIAVVVVHSGMIGDAQKDLVLTQARAAVVRAYLVGNFGFDDTQLKTLGIGKKIGANADADSGWGDVEIIVYPVGTGIPSDPLNGESTSQQ